MSTRRRVLPVVVSLVTGIAVLGACGGGSSSRSAPSTSGSATSTSSTTTTTTPSGLPRCHTGQLQASFGSLGAGAGQRYVQLVLTNTGGRCQTMGYVGVQLLGPSGQAIPTSVVRSTSSPVTTVTLAPGARASSQLHWAGIPLSDEAQTGPCEPAPVQVEVTPPNESQFTVVPWTLGSVCGHGQIDAVSLHAGVPSP